MTDTDPVSVTVEIIDQFSDDIERLRSELESLEREIGVTLDIDDNGDIEWAKASLEDLEEIIEVLLNLDTTDITKAKAELEALDNTITRSKHFVDVHRDGDTFDPPMVGDGMPGNPDFDENIFSKLGGGPQKQPGRMITSGIDLKDLGIQLDKRMLSQDRFDNIDLEFTNSDVSFKDAFNMDESPVMEGFRDLFGTKGSKPNLDKRFGGFPDRPSPFSNLRSGSGMAFPDGSAAAIGEVFGGSRGSGVPNAGISRRTSKAVGPLASVTRGFLPDGLQSPFSQATGGKNPGIMTSIKKALPSMRTWMNMLAALMPMIITLAAAVGGLVTALGGVAVAGAAAFAVGAWGIDDLQAQIDDLKSDLNDVFEPAQDVFAPFVNQFMDAIPHELGPLVDAITELQVFESTIRGAFSGLVDWVSRAIRRMSEFKSEIDTILRTVAGVFGDSIIDFFEFLVVETARNRDQFLQLAAVIGDLIRMIYNISKAVSFVIAWFRPLFGWLESITAMLDNKFVMAIMTGIAVTLGLAAAIKTIVLALGLLNGGLLTTVISGIASYIEAALVAIGVTKTWAIMLSTLTAGLTVLAGAVAAFAAFDDMGVNQEMNTYGSGGSGYGGAPSGARAGGAGGGGVYINIEGDADRDALNKLNDKFDSKWKTYSNREDDRQR